MSPSPRAPTSLLLYHSPTLIYTCHHVPPLLTRVLLHSVPCVMLHVNLRIRERLFTESSGLQDIHSLSKLLSNDRVE